ncbi:MAG: hypothetical protein ABSG13_23845 [Bryobacteraceae bacterium]|jgi:hypothetical protein
MNVNPLSYILPTNSTANNASSASSVQQQADVLGLSSNDQFLAQLQQVQSPQQYQAMISQISGQPQQTDTTATSGTPPTGHHCQGGHHASKSSQSSPINAFQASTTSNAQNQSLLASIFGSINPGSINPSQRALL